MKKKLPLLLFYFFFFLPCLYSQNIGIGTVTPAEKLHVAGNIKADTVKPAALKLTPNAGTGKILTSDAAGNANWQTNNIAGNTGYGVWGDCATNGNISEYNPVADTTGAINDLFGNNVSISGNFAIVGAPLDDVGANNNQGSASIFQYIGNNWVLMQKITDATGAAGDQFGYSVSISGNYAIVGALADDVGANVDQGSVIIYQYNGSNWVLMQKITDAGGAASDVFGNSVSISGSYAIVGASQDDVGANIDQGSANIYQLSGGIWILMQKITDATGSGGDYFGTSVAISGNYVIAGAYADNVGANTDQGSASIFQLSGGTWVLMNQITDVTGAADDFFGNSVSISGNYAIVGAYMDDVGVNIQQGSASIFRYNGTTWVLMNKITDASGAANDFFGVAVSISGNYAIIGARLDDGPLSNDQGSATIYQRVGLGWGKMQFVTDPTGSVNDNLGYSTAIDDNKRFLIGVPGYVTSSGKAVFGKIN